MDTHTNSTNSNKNTFLIIAIIIGVFAIGAAGFASWKYFSGGSEIEKNESEITKPLIEKETEKSETIEEVSNWKIYNNTKANFTFQYPKDWKIISEYFYETASGIKSKKFTVILGKNEKEEISINLRQAQCNAPCKCKEINENIIQTCSQNPEVLKIFNRVISTFKFIKVDGTSSIKILSPNGGEKLTVGNTYNIIWDCPDNAETDVFDIYIQDKRLSDKGILMPIGGSIVNCSAEKYSWQIKDISLGENCFKVQLRHIAGSVPLIDESDNYFSIAEDEIADWKTYKNEEYNYEIKYPKNWFLKKESAGITPKEYDDIKSLSFINIRSSDKFFSPEEIIANRITSIDLIVYNNSNKLSLNKWLDRYSSFGTQDLVKSRESISINGVQGIKGIHGCCSMYLKGVFLPKNDKIYLVDLVGMQPSQYLGNEKTFNQILSTFKFIE